MTMLERPRIRDILAVEAGYQRMPPDELARIIGHGHYELRDRRGRLKQHGTFRNLITEVGDKFYGDRAALILGSASTITNNTNADPSVVTTSAAHGLGVGDPVIIAGHTPSALNGSWVISAVGSTTTFTVDVGAAPGAFSSGGTATGLTLPKPNGMRLGTGTTAVAKTGAGAAIVTYTSGSAHALDGGFPTSALQGSSRRIQYKVTWAAGEATANNLAEVVLTIEWPRTDAAGSAANTISRALLSPTVNKGASDTLAVTWNHDLLGA